jgi:hypothetical protein
MPNRIASPHTAPAETQKHTDRRAERRPDPWADFLRRMLLSAGLASAAAIATTAGQDPPPAEIAEAEAPQPEPPAT